MARVEKGILLQLLVLILRPAVRFCVRHSIKLQDLTECAKKAYVDYAEQDLSKAGHTANVSRMSVMTGVHRRDVLRLQSKGIDSKSERDLLTRVMGQWMSDARFVTKSGEPRVLTEGFDGSEFHELCHSISQDINPGTLLFELRRVSAVVPAKGGIKLIHKSYVPQGDALAGFSILADDGESLIDSVEENTMRPSVVPQFHARTSYDNVDPEMAPAVKKWILKEGHEFHRRVREYVSQFDRDINPEVEFNGKGVKIVVSAFGNVEESAADDKEEASKKKSSRKRGDKR